MVLMEVMEVWKRCGRRGFTNTKMTIQPPGLIGFDNWNDGVSHNKEQNLITDQCGVVLDYKSACVQGQEKKGKE